MSRTIGGLPLKQVLDMAPEWATHVSTDARRPNTLIFESAEYYQAVMNETLLGKCSQLDSGMQEDAELLSDFTGA